MNVEKFVDKVRVMKVSEAKAIADSIKALPDNKRSMLMLKLVSILAMAADGTGEIKVETKPDPMPKAASATPRDTDDVRYC